MKLDSGDPGYLKKSLLANVPSVPMYTIMWP